MKGKTMTNFDILLLILINPRLTLWVARHSKHATKRKVRPYPSEDMQTVVAVCPCGSEKRYKLHGGAYFYGKAMLEIEAEQNARRAQKEMVDYAKRDVEDTKQIYRTRPRD
jgi:hypothetical protein